MSVPPEVFLAGIVGFAGVKPYNIIVLFMSLAYICISLDRTGFFEYLSLVVTRKAGTSGMKLFLYLFY